MSDVVELGATEAAVVELQGVSVTYPSGHIALGEVSLTIQRGEFAFLVGPSGAGKSTLIGLLVRDVLPTAGEVHVAGFPVHRLSGGEVPKLRRGPRGRSALTYPPPMVQRGRQTLLAEW